MKLLWRLWFSFFYYSAICIVTNHGIPIHHLYDHIVPYSVVLPQENDISSDEVPLKVPINFYGNHYKTLFINSNGIISFQTDIPNFFNVEFPLDYPLIAPFYSNVDTRGTGTISYHETNDKAFLWRATKNVRDNFSSERNFEATSVFIATWYKVGYYKAKTDKVNTYQVAIITDGTKTFVELLYPQEGIQWIQGTGDESGLPDARAQAGFISADGKFFTLPGSGTEQVRNLETWSNIDLSGQFIYRVDQENIVEPDLNNPQKLKQPSSCAESSLHCHVQATCIDYDEGFCCKCKKQFYGNGKYCIKKDVPLRVNGKIDGKINGERLESLDLQSYIVMTDGRAYTAISKIPESLGVDIQSLQILGGVIGYVFAKPVRNALNGYQITGGVFNYTATLTFLNTSQQLHIKQRFLGLDVFDQLRLEAHIQGEIPSLPDDAKVIVDEYQEQYTLTGPGTLQMSSTRNFKYLDQNNEEVTHYYTVEQQFLFDYCKYDNKTEDHTWKLKVGKNFISYESREQIIRFGLSNKVTPLGEVDPCDEGRSQCGLNSACVVDNDSFRCVCNPGYQQIYSNNGSTVCADIDECQSGLHSCDYNAQCYNEIGTYTCVCNPGFEGNGHICENAASCANVYCPKDSECVEINRVAMCRCLPGFTGDGQVCSPIQDHSCHKANNCAEYGICAYNPETSKYHCSCLPGYAGDGYTCTKIPTVETTTETVVTEKVLQQCIFGICRCPLGYRTEPDTVYCIADEVEYTTEITELSTLPPDLSCSIVNQCHKDAQCVQSYETDSWVCKCNQGFEGDGRNCHPVSESCKQSDCHTHATCTYNVTTGESKCICNQGYEGDGFHCRITAMCTSDADCPITEECLLTPSQRYECVCKDGHVRDSQHQCVRQNESCGGGICVENAECLFDDEYQVHYCSCKAGYYGDGIVECRLKPIGCNVLNNCGLHANCEYDPSTSLYQCKCDRGFYGDGFVCYTEINCHVDPSMCDPQATCVTDADRRYICKCRDGFIGNGTFCKQKQIHEGNFLLLNQGMSTLKVPYETSRTNVGRPIQLRSFQTAVGLDIDCNEGRVYWSDISGHAIRSSSYNGSDKSDFITKDIISPEGLAVDWVSRNIYWTDSTKDTIEVASIDTRRRKVLFNTGLVNPRGIAVHPQRGKIFWTDWDRRNPKIEWANADGTGREIFLQLPTVSLPNSLVIDLSNEQLCFTDAGAKTVECLDIDNRNKRTVATNCTYPFGIAVNDNYIYWSDWISKAIERVDKYSLNRLPALKVPLGGSGNKLFGLVAVPSRCPGLTNVCQYYKDQCPVDHICLPNGTGSRRCVCTSSIDNPTETPSCNL